MTAFLKSAVRWYPSAFIPVETPQLLMNENVIKIERICPQIFESVLEKHLDSGVTAALEAADSRCHISSLMDIQYMWQYIRRDMLPFVHWHFSLLRVTSRFYDGEMEEKDFLFRSTK